MKGLLDFASTPAGQGLLAAAFGGLAGARRGQPINSIGRAGLAGLAGYSGAQDRVGEAETRAQANELRELQMGQVRRQLSAAESAAAEKTRLDQLVRDAFLPVSGANANAATGITGPRPEAAAAIGTRRPVDFQALVAQGVPVDQVKALAESQNFGRDEVARTVETVDAQGRPTTVQLGKFGQVLGNAGGLPQWKAPINVNQGDRQTFIDPVTLQARGSFGINETPDARASRAVTMRGQNMTDARARERFAFDQTTAARGGGNQRTGPMSVTLQKELLESDDAIQSAGSVIRALQTAKAQNEKAYEGYFAKGRAQLVSNLGGSEAADATIDIDNLMTGQGLDQMKSIFGAAPTEGERKILMDMQASVDKTPKQRAAIMDRAIAAAERRATFAKSKAQAIRDGSYLTEGVRLPETPASTSAQPLPANPTASTLQRGTVYQTPRGPATWDGMQFNLVK